MGKLLFVFLNNTGHFNVCSSIAKKLLFKYPEHEVFFCVDENFFQKINDSCHLFKPVLMENLSFPVAVHDEKFADDFYKKGLESYSSIFKVLSKVQDYYILAQGRIEKVIDQVSPDVILADQLFNIPFIQNKNIPWGMVVSCNSLYVQNLPNYPPSLSGLSANAEKDGGLWIEYRNHLKNEEILKVREKWFKDCNAKLDNNDWILRGSNYLNFYTYPKYADYFQPEEIPGKWYSSSHCILDEEVENFFKSANQTSSTIKHLGKELLKDEFLGRPGKLILFSVGTLVSYHAKIMNKLLEVISILPHKFIVSCGEAFEKLKLPENCVGAPFLDQKELYPIVDIIITHGGNNTFCELFFYYQKPMILIPFFGDQFDNGARVKDLGLGTTILLENLNSKILAEAIEHITTNKNMKQKMKEAAKISKEDKSLEKFIDELNLYLKKEKS